MAGAIPELKVRAGARFADLLAGKRFEASGVGARGGVFFVVFDNTTAVARVAEDLSAAEWIETGGPGEGYEDLTWAPEDERWYSVIEAQRRKRDYQARLVEFSADWSYLADSWLEHELQDENKGFEGLAYVRRDERSHLLALCEGDGSLQVFRRRKKGDGWKHKDTLRLPAAAAFDDYAGLSVRDGRVAVVSQESSALWVGTLAADAWSFTDDGEVFHFPRDEDGRPRYCTVEGVAWLDTRRLVVVSDQANKRGRDTEQSIHIVELPRRR
jgi:hypothetical protein